MNSQEQEFYDPRIGSLVSNAERDWGDAKANKSKMIKYKVGPAFDDALYGIPVGYESEIITIQGPIKNRKSTFAANLVLNFAFQLLERARDGEEYWIAIDSLESGMSPKSWRDMLIAMIATRLMIADHYGGDRTNWPAASQIVMQDNLKPILNLSRKFFRYHERHSSQYETIEKAKAILARLPISVFGAPAKQGRTRDLEAAIARWEMLYKGEFPWLTDKLHRIFFVDHIQQYNGGVGDYANLEKATTDISGFATSHEGTIMFLLSQVSLTSIREAQSGVGKLRAKGGEKLGAESNLVIDVEYDKDLDPFTFKISASEGRDETPPVMIQEIQPTSGVALRPAYPAVQRR